MKYLRVIVSMTLIFFVSGCLDPYNPSGTSQDLSYIVIDASVNSSDGTGFVTLSYTRPLTSISSFQKVSNATVVLEEEEGGSYPFTEAESGKYSLTGASIDSNKKYRLKITTESNSEYESDFVAVKDAPPIDSISWKVIDDNVEIYANAHDESNNTRFYLWKYNETWQYTSVFASSIMLVNGEVITRPAREDIYHCFKTSQSTDILIHSTKILQNDVVREFRLTSPSVYAQRFATKYSIEVEQYALTKEGYEYWELLRKTTENVGSLFDPQPTQVTGNFHNTLNANEKAIGFFSIGAVNKKRIFINSFNKLKRDPFYFGCEETLIAPDQVGNGGLLTSPVYKGITLIGYHSAPASCVDCRYAGGTTEKPDFWQ